MLSKSNTHGTSHVLTTSGYMSGRKEIYKTQPSILRTNIPVYSKMFDLPEKAIDEAPTVTSPRSNETPATSLVKTEDSTTKLPSSFTAILETTRPKAFTTSYDEISVVDRVPDESDQSMTTVSSKTDKTNIQKVQDTTTREDSLVEEKIDSADEQIDDISSLDVNSDKSSLDRSSTERDMVAATMKENTPTTDIAVEETSAATITTNSIVNSVTTEHLLPNLSTFYQEQTDKVEKYEADNLRTTPAKETFANSEAVSLTTEMKVDFPPDATTASMSTLEPTIDVIPVDVLNEEYSHQEDSVIKDSLDSGKESYDLQRSHSKPVIPDLISPSTGNSEDDTQLDDKLDKITHNKQGGEVHFEEIDYEGIDGNLIEIIAIPEENYDDEILDEESTTGSAKMKTGLDKVTIVPSMRENSDDRDEILQENQEPAPPDAEEAEESFDEIGK